MRLPTAIPVDLLDEAQNRVLEILSSHLAATLQRVQATRAARDTQMAGLLGADTASTTVEPVVTWRAGDQPAGVELPPEQYPLLTAWAHHAAPNDGDGDLAVVDADLVIEFWVKADSATLADRRAKRMAQAIRLTFQQDDQHRVLGAGTRLARWPQDIDFSRAFERKLDAYNTRVWIMGCRLSYRLEGSE